MKNPLLRLCRYTLLILLLHTQSAFANTLAAGDIAVVGMNAITDQVWLVSLTNLPAGTEVKITDRGWNDALYQFTTSTTGDGTVTWVVGTAIPKGTVLRLYLGGSDALTTLTNLSTGQNLSISTTTYIASDPLTIAGDQIYVYQDSDFLPYFIFGMNNSSGPVDATNWNTGIGAMLRDGMRPGYGFSYSLTEGIDAVGLPGGGLQQDNVQYNGPTTDANRAVWLARLANRSNWLGENTGTVAGTLAGGSGTVVVLPIRLLWFDAEALGNTVRLRWQAAAGSDATVFDVERSSSGGAFVSLGTIASANGVEQQFIDAQPAANNSYRLKFRDRSGALQYSAVVQVRLAANAQAFQAFPNPATTSLHLRMALPAGSYSLTACDAAGRIAHIEVLSATGNTLFKTVDVSRWKAGLYWVSVNGQTELFRKE